MMIGGKSILCNGLTIDEMIIKANNGDFDPNHETLEIVGDGEIYAIDKEIAGSIKEIWDMGIRTKASCQGSNNTRGYITFSSVKDAVKFAEKRNA